MVGAGIEAAADVWRGRNTKAVREVAAFKTRRDAQISAGKADLQRFACRQRPITVEGVFCFNRLPAAER
jgi:hypothetical protein